MDKPASYQQRRFGVFGGTFDPPHIGHIELAKAALGQTMLDLVYVVPANDPYQKSQDRDVTPAHHRLAMADLAFGGLHRTTVTDIEIQRGGPSYTADTIDALSARHPGCLPCMIVGQDAVANMSTWHRADYIAEQVALMTPHYPGSPAHRSDHWDITAIYMDKSGVSSTVIREHIKDMWTRRDGMSPSHKELASQWPTSMVPLPVLEYICQNRLYR